MTKDQAMQIYQKAIDNSAGFGEGKFWWDTVIAELEVVVAAPSATKAAEAINWWHHDWRDVSDTATRAANRIRRAASKILPT